MKSKTILMVNLFKTWGGGEAKFYRYAKEYRRLGHTPVMMVSKGGILAEKVKSDGFETVEIEVNKTSWIKPKVRKIVNDILNKYQPDAVIMNSSLDLKHIASITSRNKYNLIYWRGYDSKVKPTIFNKYLFSKLSQVVTVSDFVRKNGLADITPFCVTPPITISNGKNDTESELKTDFESNLIIAAGRLDRYKNFDLVIKSMAYVRQKIPDARLKILGQGNQQEYLEQVISENNLGECVELAGFSDDVQVEMAKASLFVHGAFTEAFGIVFIEAMSQCLPCVSFTGDAADEIIRNGETGILVEERTEQALAKAIVELLSDKEKLRKYGHAGYRRFQEKFTIENAVQEFLKLM